MDIQLNFFGRISDRMGKSQAYVLTGDSETIAGLRARLAQDFDCDDLLETSVRAVINDEVVLETAQIASGDDITFMSPFSGG